MPKFIRALFVLVFFGLCFAGSSWLAGQATPAAGQRTGQPARGEGRPAQGPPPAGKQPQRSLRIEYPPLFFREDWKLDPNAPNLNQPDEPENVIGQGGVANPNLEVHVYGDKAGTRI